MTQHTAGPWKFLAEVGRIEGGITGESPVAYVAGRARKFATVDLTEAYANGTLLAAAPELLEALEAVALELHEANLAIKHGNKMRNPELTVAAEEKAKAAIRKAKGEVPA